MNGGAGADELEPAFYGGYHGDLAGLDEAALRAHWERYGRGEGRLPSLAAWMHAHGFSGADVPADFDEPDYLLLNPDVPPGPAAQALRHYLLHGRHEGRFHRFDHAFYTRFYPDLAQLGSREEALRHWFGYGIGEQRLPTLEAWLAKTATPSPFPDAVDPALLARINPHLDCGDLAGLKAALLFDTEPPLPRFSEDADENAAVFAAVGAVREARGDSAGAETCYRAALLEHTNTLACERLGALAMERRQYLLAGHFFGVAARDGDPAIRLAQARAALGAHRLDACIDAARQAAARARGSPRIEQGLRDLLNEYMTLAGEEFAARIVAGEREALVAGVATACEAVAGVYRLAFGGGGIAQPDPVHRRVLVIGDFHLPQCVRYRIEQKLEQLAAAGWSGSAVSWTEPDAGFDAIPWHDVIIFYRAPAFAEVVRLIEYARSLGKVLVYEIDDLVMDPLYPPPLASYGGNVGPLLYADLMRGMAFFRAAATLCDYALGSTVPMLERLQPLVRTGSGRVHRNGLDSHNELRPRAGGAGDRVTIFYGSGTLAHNADFIEQALPALERVLAARPQARFVVVGHLTLPRAFEERFAAQFVRFPLLRRVGSYLDCLSAADINLAVLHADPINDCKSELKWFEAACYAIPSIVSPTRNYLDVVRDGVDALLAEGHERWHAALLALVDDPALRARIGAAAQERVARDYAVGALGAGLDASLQQFIADHLGRLGAAPAPQSGGGA